MRKNGQRLRKKSSSKSWHKSTSAKWQKMIAADTAIHQSKIKISSIGKEVIQEVMKRQIRQTSSDLKKREN